MTTRRRLLAVAGALLPATLAGCVGDDTTDDAPESTEDDEPVSEADTYERLEDPHADSPFTLGQQEDTLLITLEAAESFTADELLVQGENLAARGTWGELSERVDSDETLHEWAQLEVPLADSREWELELLRELSESETEVLLSDSFEFETTAPRVDARTSVRNDTLRLQLETATPTRADEIVIDGKQLSDTGQWWELAPAEADEVSTAPTELEIDLEDRVGWEIQLIFEGGEEPLVLEEAAESVLDRESNVAPTPIMDWNQTPDELIIEITGGDPLPTEEIRIEGRELATEGPLGDFQGSHPKITYPGDEIHVPLESEDEWEIELIWDGGDEATVIASQSG